MLNYVGWSSVVLGGRGGPAGRGGVGGILSSMTEYIYHRHVNVVLRSATWHLIMGSLDSNDSIYNLKKEYCFAFCYISMMLCAATECQSLPRPALLLVIQYTCATMMWCPVYVLYASTGAHWCCTVLSTGYLVVALQRHDFCTQQPTNALLLPAAPSFALAVFCCCCSWYWQ